MCEWGSIYSYSRGGKTGKQERRGENINITTVQYAQCYSYPSDISIFSAHSRKKMKIERGR